MVGANAPVIIDFPLVATFFAARPPRGATRFGAGMRVGMDGGWSGGAGVGAVGGVLMVMVGPHVPRNEKGRRAEARRPFVSENYFAETT